MDESACRRLVLEMLKRGVRAARQGNAIELAWVRGPASRQWAEALGLDEWPPRNLGG